MSDPQHDWLVFADDGHAPEPELESVPSPPLRPGSGTSIWKVLVVDDEPDVIAITRAALNGCRFMDRQIQILGAASAEAGRQMLLDHADIAVILLDVVMETDDAGLRLAQDIRERMKRYAIRIILRTGQPGLAPERDVILRYDINDYRLKTDLTAQSLYTSVVAALRAYHEILSRMRAEEQAVLANKAKNEFLANINHELRTPLNAIIGLADLMAGEAFGPLGHQTYHEFAHDILRSARDLYDTIEAILDVATIETGTLVLQLEPVKPAGLVERVLRLMTPAAEQAVVALRSAVVAELPELRGDVRRLRQMLAALVSNAIKFTPAGGSVVVGVAPLVGTAVPGVVITVEDSGIGMSRDEIDLALSLFQQVDGSLSRRREGSGLGLPLARAFVELHGGSLSIASQPGQGTAVTVTLPANLVKSSGSSNCLLAHAEA
ncbi:histidine kinase [uncultured Gammaproteobacteria bacterium]